MLLSTPASSTNASTSCKPSNSIPLPAWAPSSILSVWATPTCALFLRASFWRAHFRRGRTSTSHKSPYRLAQRLQYHSMCRECPICSSYTRRIYGTDHQHLAEWADLEFIPTFRNFFTTVLRGVRAGTCARNTVQVSSSFSALIKCSRSLEVRLAYEKLMKRRRFVIWALGLLVATGQFLDGFGRAFRACTFLKVVTVWMGPGCRGPSESVKEMKIFCQNRA